jgi:hypothetical protein
MSEYTVESVCEPTVSEAMSDMPESPGVNPDDLWELRKRIDWLVEQLRAADTMLMRHIGTHRKSAKRYEQVV